MRLIVLGSGTNMHPKRAAAGYHEGFQATALAIKANEAVMAGKRVELKPELYELS